MNEKIRIGELIQRKLDENGQKQKWLADKMQCSESTISRMCKNQNINTNRLIPICKILKYNFFSDYVEYVENRINGGNPTSPILSHSPISPNFTATEEIHIGKIIRKIKDENGIKTNWLAKKIGCTEKNAYNLYKRKTIDTAQLVTISIYLKFNFFWIYTEYAKK